jgi:hypothetical protein
MQLGEITLFYAVVLTRHRPALDYVYPRIHSWLSMRRLVDTFSIGISNECAPQVGQWYLQLDTKEAFFVTAYDDKSHAIETQANQ